MKRRIKWIAVLLFVCILFSGCDFRNYFYSEDSLKRVAEKALEKKYGEEFVVYRAWDRSQTAFFAECSPQDNLEVVFRADIWKNGDGVIADGYAQGIVAQEVDIFLHDDFEELFGSCYTKEGMLNYYNIKEFGSVKNITIKEYLSHVHVDYIGYYVFIPLSSISYDTVDEEYEFFSEKLQNEVQSGTIPNVVVRLFFVDEKMFQDSQNYFETRVTYDSTFADDLDKYTEISFAYPDNLINMTYEEYKRQREIIKANK